MYSFANKTICKLTVQSALLMSVFYLSTYSLAGEVSIEVGRAVYEHYCTPCHGEKGDGNGFNAPYLLVKPANHTDAAFMSARNDRKLMDAVDFGGVEVAKSTLMPPWGAVLGNDKLKSVVMRLRELCKCESTEKW